MLTTIVKYMVNQKHFDEVGGISADIIRIALPWSALTLAGCLGVGLSLINTDMIRTQPEQNVVAAACCIAGAAMYLVYMVVNKMLSLFIRSINAEYNSRVKLNLLKQRNADYIRSITPADNALSQCTLLVAATGPVGPTADGADELPSVASETVDAAMKPTDVECGDGNAANEGVDADAECDYDDETDELSVFLAARQPPPHNAELVLREEVIASMYLGGTGAFLAIQSLCMWDATVTAVFILALQICALPERIKVLEYRANVDRVVAIHILRSLHWAQHILATSILVLTIWRDQHIRPTPIVWQMCAFAACAPPLLKAGSQHWSATCHTRALSPTHTLESGLPVCTLLAILVLCWYSPVEILLERHISWSRVLCLISMNPPALAVMITFILRGFRRYHTLGVIVVLTTLAVMRRQWFASEWTERGMELAILFLTVILVAVAASRAFYRMDAVASDELSYAELYGTGRGRRRRKKPKVVNLQHISPYDY